MAQERMILAAPDATDMMTTPTAGASPRTGRRGLIAGAAALAVGLAVRQSVPVAANTDGGALIIATSNTASLTTSLVALPTFSQNNGAFVAGFDAAPAPAGQSVAGAVGYGGGDNGNGLMGGGEGVSFQSNLGDFAAGAGVLGRATGGNPGVYGINTNSISASGFGVEGSSTSNVGTFGRSTSSIGVYGYSTSASGTGGYSVSANGVTGVTGATGGDVAGVRGSGNDAGTHGVRGTNSGTGAGVTGAVTGNGTGVNGMSATGIGVYGVHSDPAGTGSPYGVVGAVAGLGFGVYGVVNTAGAVAFAGGAGVNGAIAAQFSGPVNIYHTPGTTNGNLYIQGGYTAGGTKSAAVPHPDGTHRLLYCVESPEAWFEDFGTGTITGGKAEVTLDPDFAAVVDMSTLHAFTEAHDEHHALHVASKSATGFTVGVNPSAVGVVAGKKASDLSGTFTYRVVAKRKDGKAERLAKFTVPQAVAAAPPPLPPAPKEESRPPAPPQLPLPKR